MLLNTGEQSCLQHKNFGDKRWDLRGLWVRGMGVEGRARIEEASQIRSIPCLTRSVASLQNKDPIPKVL